MSSGPGGSGLEEDRLRAELARAQRRIAQLEASTSMRLGQALISSARNPRSSVRLPRQMLAMWRGRRAGGARRAARSVEPGEAPTSQAALLAGMDFLPAGTGGPVVAGVLRDATAADLSSTGQVVPLLPHSALEVLDRVQPDLILVESAAAVAPSAWAHLGDPAAADRLRALQRVRLWARSADVPVVLWRCSPPHLSVFLAGFAADADLVVAGPEASGSPAWDCGLPLAGNVAWGGQRTGVVMLGGNDPAAGAVRHAALDAVARELGDELTVLADPDGPGATGSGGLHRRARSTRLLGFATGLANPFGAPGGGHGAHRQTLALLAAGLRVLTGPDPDLEGMPGVHVLADARGAAGAVADLRSAAALSPVEHAAVLRRLHLDHAPSHALAGLAALVAGSAPPPRRALAAAVVTDDLAGAATAIIGQALPPSEVVVRRGAWREEAHRRLTDAGIPVVVVPDGVEPASASVAPAAVVGDLRDPRVLLDLEVAALATNADVVGLHRAPGTLRISSGTSPGTPPIRWDLPA